MLEDKSLFHYGTAYSRLIDPLMRPTRAKIVALVPESAAVLDIGCGTGKLCFELHQQKNCRVLGADLSLRMLAFAREQNPFEDVQFMHQDATNLTDIQDGSYDVVVVSFLIHELFAEAQQRLIQEAWRVGRSCILADSNVPLSRNPSGLVKRMIEFAFGFEHYPQFRAYLASGGIIGLLQQCSLDHKIVHRESYLQETNQIVVVSHA